MRRGPPAPATGRPGDRPRPVTALFVPNDPGFLPLGGDAPQGAGVVLAALPEGERVGVAGVADGNVDVGEGLCAGVVVVGVGDGVVIVGVGVAAGVLEDGVAGVAGDDR